MRGLQDFLGVPSCFGIYGGKLGVKFMSGVGSGIFDVVGGIRGWYNIFTWELYEACYVYPRCFGFKRVI